jgi:protocatechuate 3,4-dioxygenase beta subunit
MSKNLSNLDTTDRRLSRRDVLRLGGVSVAGALLAACANDKSTPSDTATRDTSTPSVANPLAVDSTAAASVTTDTSAAVADTSTTLPLLTAATFAALGTCRLSPEKTAGPYPLDEQFDRRDVTEGVPGSPMRLAFRVLDASCKPITDAKVEIWHTDSTGDYSAYIDNGGGKDDGPGTTFCRGTQPTNAEGIVEFHTIYPGWYSGRAVHIHLRVHLNDKTVLTSQVFFEPEYMATIYAAAPYADNGLPDTPVTADGIAGDAKAEQTILTTTAGPTLKGAGTLALLNLGVDPAAVSSAEGFGGGPGGPGDPGSPPAGLGDLVPPTAA